ncbi:PDR/VanB family oxidoreductase [Tsukamurella sp. 8F]|uniref:PDR/VanB family oxidoreductase n=1 Tax=unclassified Tsukamurella TaxID=2633480 RepID=UPI0023B8CE58|nr:MULTISPECIES: PDR/VanB family oxidoreductase [unclassified Tsukamurella]MDF0528527.1 PDR/VanB family oxidoreductase [Tsukamurella sp. 8J]MDF0586353.1 PDR/VanB family oxidoreductase [Tsukamurella sp. 8F]
MPPHLYGRWKHDPLLRFSNAFFSIVLPTFNHLMRPRHLAEPDRTRTLRIVEREIVAHDKDVVALRLVADDERPLLPWTPGAHLDLLLPSGRMREYSLCGDPADQESYRIAVRRIPHGGGGSVEVHETLHIGSTVTIKGPRNGMPLAVPGYGSPARRIRFVAGGIGITPILSMMIAAERIGLDWSMIYTGRSEDTIPFISEVERFGDKVEVRTDDVHGIPSAQDLIGDTPDPTAIYACGPLPMLETLRVGLIGRIDVELHYERFSAPPVVDGRPISVTLASTGETVEVAADETVLSAVLARRPGAPYSCRQGFCGTCRVQVLDGEIDHRDHTLTPYEREHGQMLTCVSRAKGDHLTLDL